MYSQLGYLIKALKETTERDEDIRTAKGKYQYPRTFWEGVKKGYNNGN